jgi:hypothetical protein
MLAYNGYKFSIIVSPWKWSCVIETYKRDNIIKQKRGLILCTLSPAFVLLTVKMHGLTWLFIYILGPLEKLREVTNNLIMSVRTSVLPQVSTRILLDGFSWNLILGTFIKICREYVSCFNRTQISGTLHEYVTTQDNILFNSSYIKKIFTKNSEKIKTNFMLNKFVKNRAVHEIITKNTAEPDRSWTTECSIAQITFDSHAG